MIKLIATLGVVLIFSCRDSKEKHVIIPERTYKLPYYSKIVQDSFIIDAYLPDTSGDKTGVNYPVVFVLDGNLYFEIYASLLKQYNNVGLLPKVILIGIGYPTFQKMDSLRQRDYTYPEALAEYEMPVSGKGDAFRNALNNEFVPFVDSLFSTYSSRRILMGHSLGGYFSLYSMYQDQLKNSFSWMGYIAASPSLHYNNSYLLNRFDSLFPKTMSHQKVFISYGSEEGREVAKENHISLDSLLLKCKTLMDLDSTLEVRTVVYSNMDHMDTQLPTFIKGLRWMLQKTPTD